jgi:hypothetical protein
MTDSRLPAYALFAAFLASAGLPLYIHAPKFYVDEYNVSLSRYLCSGFWMSCKIHSWAGWPTGCARGAGPRLCWQAA